jgi:hypoxanthine phosphoribosyltransferase
MVITAPDFIHEVFSRATCIHSRADIEKSLDHMAFEMNNHPLADENPLFLCVVMGAIIPLGNLLLRLNFPLQLDYIHATRYQSDIVGKQLCWKAKPSEQALRDRTVVIFDDILDEGVTLTAIIDFCKAAQAKKVYTAVLLDKKATRAPGGLARADFTALEVDNHYVFGYGMDYKGYLRNVAGIYRVAPEHE